MILVYYEKESLPLNLSSLSITRIYNKLSIENELVF